MQNDEHSPTDTIPAPGSSPDDSPNRVQLSANMTARLEKLAPCRIDPSLIKFPKRGPKFVGGYAIVSRAFLASSLDDAKDRAVESSGKDLKSDGCTPKAENHNECREREGSNEEARPEQAVVAETQEQESDSETSGCRKAVAVKRMNVKTSEDAMRVLGLTLREAEFLVKLSHENIIKLEGFVEDVSKEMIWLVFPWEDNGTLKDFVAAADWEIPERISLLNDVARGVKYLHTRTPPIFHGDLKSINILVNSNCRAVLTDFGSARHPITKPLSKETQRTKSEPKREPSPEATFCPSTNTITLTCNQYTLRWAAPELLEDDDASLASDIWALGCVVYEVMTDSIPFQDVKDAVVIKRIVRGDLPSISTDARMLLVQALCTLVGQCWTVDPSTRPTAEYCQKAIQWMPMIAPNPARSTDAAGFANRSPELLMRLGRMHRRQDDYSTASKDFAEALALYTEMKDSQGKADALWQLANIYKLHNEYSQAAAFYSDVINICTELGDHQGRASALGGLAGIWTDTGNKPGRAGALWGLAEVHRARKEYSQAVTFYSECLQIWTDTGNRRERADALCGLAAVHQARREYEQAATLYPEALQIRIDIGDRLGRAEALRGLADIHRAQKENSQAMVLYSEALTIFTDIGNKRRTALILECIAKVHRDQEDHSSAIQHYEQAAKIYKQMGRTDNEATALKRAADVRRVMERKVA
ncbi:hypothetical protein M407DRAFT_32674 [Tulasnella calospora MUT 4182]|uniref:Protein kinase domain-containing protein n=1 Tax=Tulasnella calospora MUT 4182 TaxID=1051891 RepID=A0A0C3K884_9AGAM|nr:hypothetical protein M407DRAFT_32674 [Tulasnella calospora MUT 4182]